MPLCQLGSVALVTKKAPFQPPACLYPSVNYRHLNRKIMGFMNLVFPFLELRKSVASYRMPVTRQNFNRVPSM